VSQDIETVRVQILDKDYQVACPAPQKEGLLEAARYLDQQMRAIRQSGKVIGVERIAVMAALNISHEFLQQGHTTEKSSESESSVTYTLGTYTARLGSLEQQRLQVISRSSRRG
jgi:cell division protein ZapA